MSPRWDSEFQRTSTFLAKFLTFQRARFTRTVNPPSKLVTDIELH